MNSVTPDSYSPDKAQEFYKAYSTNHILPEIDWQDMFSQNQLMPEHVAAFQAIYQATVPIALTTLQRLNIDVFSPAGKQPQGLDLFNKLRAQESKLVDSIVHDTLNMDEAVLQNIWSMLLRGGAVLVFKAWLGKVKTGEDVLDLLYFNELADLLWMRSNPYELAAKLGVDPQTPCNHLFLIYEDRTLLDRFNTVETAELFVQLGVYDATMLSASDARLRDYFLEHHMVEQEQLDELLDAMNPLYSDLPQQHHKLVKHSH